MLQDAVAENFELLQKEEKRTVVDRYILVDGRKKNYVVSVVIPSAAKIIPSNGTLPTYIRLRAQVVGVHNGEQCLVNMFVHCKRLKKLLGVRFNAHPVICEKVMSDGAKYVHIDLYSAGIKAVPTHHLVCGAGNHSDSWWQMNHHALPAEKIGVFGPKDAFVAIAHGAEAKRK